MKEAAEVRTRKPKRAPIINELFLLRDWKKYLDATDKTTTLREHTQ